MPTHTPSLSPRDRDLGRKLYLAYCAICQKLFGRTFSVMAGEAQDKGYWLGSAACVFIDLLLRDPGHCENEFNAFKSLTEHRRFLLGRRA